MPTGPILRPRVQILLMWHQFRSEKVPLTRFLFMNRAKRPSTPPRRREECVLSKAIYSACVQEAQAQFIWLPN